MTLPNTSGTPAPRPRTARRGRPPGRSRKKRDGAASELLGNDCDLRAEACVGCRDHCIDLVRCCAGRCVKIGSICDNGGR